MSVTSATLFIVANMIGAGVFTTSGLALADLGEPIYVLLAWLVGGIIAFSGALCYGALARCYPESGGEYVFLGKSLHPFAGFLAGWVSLFAGFTAPIAVAAAGFQHYITGMDIFGANQSSVQAQWPGAAAILLASLCHCIYSRFGVLVQNFAVLLKLTVLLVFIVVGISVVKDTTSDTIFVFAQNESLNFSHFSVVLMWVLYSYSGWNASVYISGEIRDPDRNVGLSLIFGTLLTTTIYLLLNFVFLYATPGYAIAGKTDIATVVASAIGGEVFAQCMAGLISLALFTSILSMLMAGSRVWVRMADDRLLPAVLDKKNENFSAAIVLQTLLALVVFWFSELAQLLSYIGLLLTLSSSASVLALVMLRLRLGADKIPIPAYPWAPLLFVVSTAVLAITMSVQQPLVLIAALLTITVCLICYCLMKRKSRQGI